MRTWLRVRAPRASRTSDILAWAYPAFAYGELRAAIAAETCAQAAKVLPGHGIQALIGTLCGALLEPGDRVVVPEPTYGLYAQASAVAGAEVVRLPAPDLELDLEAVAAAAEEHAAKLVWICDPNNPTGSPVEHTAWRAFLDAVPPGYLLGDTALVRYLDAVQEPFNVNRAALAAGLASLGRPPRSPHAGPRPSRPAST